MEVDPLTKIEKKKRKFKNLINWLALKLGVASCL
jgi:hypothetical protein